MRAGEQVLHFPAPACRSAPLGQPRLVGPVLSPHALLPWHLQVTAETLKAALLATTTAGALGEAAQAPLMQLLVPLLIEVASPPAGGASSPLLADMALKLITHLASPSGPAAAAFRAAVAGLPLGAKQRLQQALQSAGGGAGPAAGASGAAASVTVAPAAGIKPSIALKTFASLKHPETSM